MLSILEKYITIVVIDCGYRFYHQELPRPLETRFDPGYYDNPSGNRKKGMPYTGSKKKIELPSKELVELRKAEKRWSRPSEVEVDLAQVEKETQVYLCWIT